MDPRLATEISDAATRSPATLVRLNLGEDVQSRPAVSCRWKTSKPLRIFTGDYVSMTAIGRRRGQGEPVLSRPRCPWVPACSALPQGLFVQPDPGLCWRTTGWTNLRFHGTRAERR